MFFRISHHLLPSFLKNEPPQVASAVGPIYYAEIATFLMAFFGYEYCEDALRTRPLLQNLAYVTTDHVDPKFMTYEDDPENCMLKHPGVVLTDFSDEEGKKYLTKFMMKFNLKVRFI